MNEGGLYPYRRFAYLVWVVVPAVMASLAFLNPHYAYVTQGAYCMLPVRPFWYRLGLSWVPRYVILAIILGTYIAIYAYVGRKFRSIEIELGHPSSWRRMVVGERNIGSSATGFDGRDSPERDMPRCGPRLHCHGLPPPGTGSISSSISWFPQDMIFGGTVTASTSRLLAVERESHTLTETRSIKVVPNSSKLQIPGQKDGVGSESSSQRGTLEVPNVVSMMDVLKDSQLYNREFIETRQISKTDLERGQKNMSASNQLLFAHRNIRRQLRLLFVYPLVYFMMWMIPFANHCLQYRDNYTRHPSFILSCFVMVDLALQCAVNCILFSTREKVPYIILLPP